MASKHPIFGIPIAVAVILIGAAVAAQQAPYGSCLMPNGQWCWPQIPGNFGETCICVTPNGSFYGTIQ